MSDTVTIKLKIKSCIKCPFHDSERYYTAVAFEMVFTWYCEEMQKEIGKTEIFDKDLPIPDWCPFREA
jgi:hypothetical protein